MEDVAVFRDGLDHMVGQILGIFYADGGVISSRVLEWLQGNLNVLIGLFWSIVLAANVVKSKTMVCHPGAII